MYNLKLIVENHHEEQSVKYLAKFSKNGNVIKERQRLKNYSRLEKIKEKRQLIFIAEPDSV